MTTDRLRWATEVIVVLGGGLRPDGGASRSTLLRAEKAAELATLRPSSLVVLSGSRGGAVIESDGERPEHSEARHMADLLRSQGIAEERLFEEDESRDTIGNAVLVRARYLNGIAPRPLTIVTSPHHAERSLFIFRKVFPAPWEISVQVCAPAENAAERAALEPALMREAEEFFADLPPDDFLAICEWLVRRHPYYAGVSAHS